MWTHHFFAYFHFHIFFVSKRSNPNWLRSAPNFEILNIKNEEIKSDADATLKVNKGLVFLDHHHTLGWLVDDRCTFRCMSQCVAFIVAFSGGLAQQRFTLVLCLWGAILLDQDKCDIFLSARLTRFLIVFLVTILVWDLKEIIKGWRCSLMINL